MKKKEATAAVAIIQARLPEQSFLILRRNSHPNDPWSGHFSFPGGRMDSTDDDLLATCLRETHEETGISLSKDALQDSLPMEPAGRNFNSPLWVKPYLFSLENPPDLKLEAHEIQSGTWLSAEQFRDPSNHKDVEMLPGQLFPAFAIADYYLWGFTYRLLSRVIPLRDI